MGLIGINKLIFVSAVSNMNSSGDAIDGTITTWTSQGEESQAFSAFVQNYAILQDIVYRYKNMVLKDIKTIDEIGEKLMDTDSRLSLIWGSFK